MTDKTTVDVNLLYATITVIIAVVGCIFAVKQNRKKDEEVVKNTVNGAVKESEDKAELKLKIEQLEREKLAGAVENIRNDYQLDNGKLRDLTKDVSQNKGDIAILKEFKEHHEQSTNKLFEKIDNLTEKQNNDSMQILEKISDLSIKIAKK